MKTIAMTASAAKDFFALPGAIQDQVDAALDRYAMIGEGDVTALKNAKGEASYRLRTGRYRVLFDEDETTILAIHIGKRETTTYKKGRT